jgi:hypothetical protein
MKQLINSLLFVSSCTLSFVIVSQMAFADGTGILIG